MSQEEQCLNSKSEMVTRETKPEARQREAAILFILWLQRQGVPSPDMEELVFSWLLLRNI